MSFVPPYPKPMPSGGRWFKLLLNPVKFFKARRCAISGLMDKSYSMHLGESGLVGKRVFIPNQPELVQRVLVDEIEKFPKSTVVADMFGTLVGDGLIVSNGTVWQRQRRIMAPVFEQARNKLVFGLMREAVDAMMARFARIAAAREPAAVDVEMTHVTADVIYRTIFGEALEADDARRMFGAFQEFQEAAYSHGMTQMTGMPALLSRGKLSKAKVQAKVIRDFLDPKVKARHEAALRGEANSSGDILGALIAATDPQDGSRFDLRELSEQVAMLFLGGHETSASTLAWNFYLLAMDQECQDRVAAEVRHVFGDGPLEYGGLKRLRHTRNVISETLRLFPPISFLPRDAACPVTMRGKQISTGDVVQVSPWLMQRHRRYWKDPDVFDPSRFEREESKEALRNCYFPFSKGPRVCIGASFALQEAAMIVANLVRAYRFLPIAGREPRLIGRLTLRSENGIALKIEERHHAVRFDG